MYNVLHVTCKVGDIVAASVCKFSPILWGTPGARSSFPLSCLCASTGTRVEQWGVKTDGSRKESILDWVSLSNKADGARKQDSKPGKLR